jgi:hypothetical protein
VLVQGVNVDPERTVPAPGQVEAGVHPAHPERGRRLVSDFRRRETGSGRQSRSRQRAFPSGRLSVFEAVTPEITKCLEKGTLYFRVRHWGLFKYSTIDSVRDPYIW